MEHHERVVFVTDASSGYGNACATYLAKKGFKTYASCGDPAQYDRKADEFFELVQMNCVEDDSVVAAAKLVLSKEGHVDHIVLCPGLGSIGSIERNSVDDAHALMETSYFCALRILRAFLPAMREAGRGRIIVAASILGSLGLPFLGRYSAAQRALGGLAESLGREIRPFGIETCLLEVGGFVDAIDENAVAKLDPESEGPYAGALKSLLERLRNEARTVNGPLAVAKEAYSLLTRRSMPARRYIGSLSLRLAAWFRRALPARVSDALIGAPFES